MMIHIVIGGNDREIKKGTTVTQLLADEKVEMPEYVSVSVNEEILPRESCGSYVLKDGDAVECLYFMGGGK